MVSWFNIPGALETIIHKLDILEGQMTSAQGDINAADTFLQQLVSDLQAQSTTLANVVTGIQQLQAELAAGGTVDTSQLDSLVSQAQQAQSAVDNAVANANNALNPPPATTP